MKFNEFNHKVNPTDLPCYVAHVPGKYNKTCTYKEVRDIAVSEPMLQIFWRPQENFIVIQTNSINIEPTIISKNVFAYKDGKSIFIVAQSDFKRTTINNMLACGICANTYYGKKNDVPIPFFNKAVCVNTDARSYSQITPTAKIDNIPLWLTPLSRVSKTMPEGIDIPITTNTTIVLNNMLSRLKPLDRFQQQDVIKFINSEFCTTPCTNDELENILHTVENATLAQFYERDTFCHNKLGDYVIEHCNVIRDEASRELYFYDKAKQIYSCDPDYLMGYMTKLCPSLRNYQKEETLKYITSYLYDETVQLNSDPFTVVFKNGILNIRDMILRPMSPEYYESIRINANYDPSVYSPTIDEFFYTATDGNKDIEMLLFEAMGYSMLKTSELQKGFILTGTGRNGKSTYLDLIKSVLGKHNTAAVSFKDLSNNFRASQLKGKLASLAGDVSAQPLSDSDLVKSITSGEEITIEQKYKDAHQEALFATLFFACNKLPRTPDTSDGFYRRWTIVPFIADLSTVTRVAGMSFKTKLLEQQSLDYAAYKAIHAIKRVLETTEEFTRPAATEKIMQEYKTDNSAVLSFIKEEYGGDTVRASLTPIATLYGQYTSWAYQSNRGTMSRHSFITALKTEAHIEVKYI